MTKTAIRVISAIGMVTLGGLVWVTASAYATAPDKQPLPVTLYIPVNQTISDGVTVDGFVGISPILRTSESAAREVRVLSFSLRVMCDNKPASAFEGSRLVEASSTSSVEFPGIFTGLGKDGQTDPCVPARFAASIGLSGVDQWGKVQGAHHINPSVVWERH